MSEFKECPYCAEEILVKAIKCKHCHSMLEEELVPDSAAGDERQVKAAPSTEQLPEKNEVVSPPPLPPSAGTPGAAGAPSVPPSSQAAPPPPSPAADTKQHTTPPPPPPENINTSAGAPPPFPPAVKASAPPPLPVPAASTASAPPPPPAASYGAKTQQSIPPPPPPFAGTPGAAGPPPVPPSSQATPPPPPPPTPAPPPGRSGYHAAGGSFPPPSGSPPAGLNAGAGSPHAAYNYHKAQLGKRVLAYLVDTIIATLPLAFTAPIALIPFYRFIISDGRYEPDGVGVLLIVLGLLVSFGWAMLYSLLRDGFGKGQSIGKKATGLMVVRLRDNLPCTRKDSLLRNVVAIGVGIVFGWIPVLNFFAGFAEPIIAIVHQKGMRLGDQLAKTQVIAVRDYQNKG